MKKNWLIMLPQMKNGKTIWYGDNIISGRENEMIIFGVNKSYRLFIGTFFNIKKRSRR